MMIQILRISDGLQHRGYDAESKSPLVAVQSFVSKEIVVEVEVSEKIVAEKYF